MFGSKKKGGICCSLYEAMKRDGKEIPPEILDEQNNMELEVKMKTLQDEALEKVESNLESLECNLSKRQKKIILF
jgi:predicted transcriptional regulator